MCRPACQGLRGARAPRAGLAFVAGSTLRAVTPQYPPGSILDRGEDGFVVLGQDGRQHAHPVPVGERAELAALLGLRDAMLELREAEASGARARAERLRCELNDRYDAYADTFGAINRFSVRRSGWVPTGEFRPAQGGFAADPSAAAVRALEIFDASRNSASKAELFAARPDGAPQPNR